MQQQADRIAHLYNQIGATETPQVIVALRVALRETAPQKMTDKEEAGTSSRSSSSSSTGDTEQETRGAAQQHKRRKRARRGRKRRVKLTQKSIKELSTIPRHGSADVETGKAESASQTLSRRRQGAFAAKPKTLVQLHHEQHGDEDNGHSSRDGSLTPCATRTLSQTGKRRRVKDCAEEMNPERRIEDYKRWISPEAKERLEKKENEKSHKVGIDHEAATQPYQPASERPPRGAESSQASRPRPTCQQEPEYAPSTQDERQTERWHELQAQAEYDKQLQEEAAEANYLAEYQEELNITEAMENYEQDEPPDREVPESTLSDNSES